MEDMSISSRVVVAGVIAGHGFF
jgi:hypothetical protein